MTNLHQINVFLPKLKMTNERTTREKYEKTVKLGKTLDRR